MDFASWSPKVHKRYSAVRIRKGDWTRKKHIVLRKGQGCDLGDFIIHFVYYVQLWNARAAEHGPQFFAISILFWNILNKVPNQNIGSK